VTSIHITTGVKVRMDSDDWFVVVGVACYAQFPVWLWGGGG
jgi:hypothetical protein